LNKCNVVGDLVYTGVFKALYANEDIAVSRNLYTAENICKVPRTYL